MFRTKSSLHCSHGEASNEPVKEERVDDGHGKSLRVILFFTALAIVNPPLRKID